MGGGRQYFYGSDEADPEYPDKNGTRQDGHNLVQVNILGNLNNLRCNSVMPRPT